MSNRVRNMASRVLSVLRQAHPARLPRLVLSKIYGFDAWNIAPYSSRPYAKCVVDYVNSRAVRGALVDVGCGIGDIIARARYIRRLGLDRDEGVIRAASLTRQDIDYRVFVWPDPLPAGLYDVIVLVNWIAAIPPDELKRTIAEYCRCLTPGGEIIIDTLQAPQYLYNHSAEQLAGGRVLTRIGSGFAGQRELWSIRP